jgi:hypothetical protein
MALQPNLGPGLFNPTPPGISILCRPLLQFLHFNILLASLSTASYCILLSFPTGLLPSLYPFSAFLGSLSSFIFIT